MKNTIKISLAVTTALMLAACSNTGNTDIQSSGRLAQLEKTGWLTGKWQNSTNEGTATETWIRQNDSTYTATSYFVVGKDTVSSEKISLVQQGEDVFYIPVVRDQNDGQPVKFKMTGSANDLLVFENPAHDFPQKITYRKVSENELLAEISGVMNGKQRTQQFPMSRVNAN